MIIGYRNKMLSTERTKPKGEPIVRWIGSYRVELDLDIYDVHNLIGLLYQVLVEEEARKNGSN